MTRFNLDHSDRRSFEREIRDRGMLLYSGNVPSGQFPIFLLDDYLVVGFINCEYHSLGDDLGRPYWAFSTYHIPSYREMDSCPGRAQFESVLRRISPAVRGKYPILANIIPDGEEEA